MRMERLQTFDCLWVAMNNTFKKKEIPGFRRAQCDQYRFNLHFIPIRVM